MKKCRVCGEIKPLSAYHRRSESKDGRQGWCKECARADLKRRYDEDPQVRAKKINAGRLRLGVTCEKYREMLLAQDGKCAICNQGCSTGRDLALDHNHETGRIRSLLCTNCNNGVGRFKDNPKLLEAAAEYLRDHSIERT